MARPSVYLVSTVGLLAYTVFINVNGWVEMFRFRDQWTADQLKEKEDFIKKQAALKNES